MWQGNAMAQTVSCQPLTTEARVHPHINPCGICGGQSSTGTGFSTSSSVFPVNIIPPWLSILICHLRDEQTSPLVTVYQTHRLPHRHEQQQTIHMTFALKFILWDHTCAFYFCNNCISLILILLVYFVTWFWGERALLLLSTATPTITAAIKAIPAKASVK
jgi:hypothetical protein